MYFTLFFKLSFPDLIKSNLKRKDKVKTSPSEELKRNDLYCQASPTIGELDFSIFLYKVKSLLTTIF